VARRSVFIKIIYQLLIREMWNGEEASEHSIVQKLRNIASRYEENPIEADLGCGIQEWCKLRYVFIISFSSLFALKIFINNFRDLNDEADELLIGILRWNYPSRESLKSGRLFIEHSILLSQNEFKQVFLRLH